eukprot:CAMPEP_0119150274 /NCGR_PEP_ID=MMETSP1310-20130426/44573_1 /TAXON_ID=464262 /ORGANISM="Genus nov. species nov., Strain RCC2339" /LENGTH=108 /DNA_ID=CAMNT_0007142451 /DNA_START=383 /DNA_END=705 /DNA_ORIENTATION=-
MTVHPLAVLAGSHDKGILRGRQVHGTLFSRADRPPTPRSRPCPRSAGATKRLCLVHTTRPSAWSSNSASHDRSSLARHPGCILPQSVLNSPVTPSSTTRPNTQMNTTS